MIRPKILSIDDIKMIHRVIEKTFKSFECELLFAFNGQEGLAAAARELPKVIILDTTMPVMDGFETLARLKADPTLKGIPVIMLAAEAESENVLKIARMGVRDFVAKPFTEDALLERVGRFVKLSPKSSADGPGSCSSTWKT
jgi:two-component system cell cycle response regulator